MEDAAERVHNRNLIRTEEHLSISVDNDRSNLDALNESQNPKIDSSNSKSTTDSDRIYSGLREDPRLQQPTVNQRRNCAKPVIKNSQKITEQKNEILSRTVYVRAIKKLFKVVLYYVIVLLILNAQFGADSAPAKQGNTSVGHLRGPGNGRRFSHGSPQWKRPEHHRRNLNKNCKEYDITSRAFSADLIFEGKARSKRELGQYITFGIHKILKLRKTALKPKTQIRLHFGGRRTADVPRKSLLSDCLSLSIPSNDIVDTRWKLKFGTNYFVFANLSGPMNYTANGDPVVANKRNLKSIRSVIAKDKGKSDHFILERAMNGSDAGRRLARNGPDTPFPRRRAEPLQLTLTDITDCLVAQAITSELRLKHPYARFLQTKTDHRNN
ncbi:UNVERIFIED_CONTAM: hypothetical protein PYX00_009002 [Menopon gallinae]|uniref:Uncharacterized protein n=1 Tax=Menopon gallinae TaxID=328185 RepID=A0AAW2H9S8_9NEOP